MVSSTIISLLFNSKLYAKLTLEFVFAVALGLTYTTDPVPFINMFVTIAKEDEIIFACILSAPLELINWSVFVTLIDDEVFETSFGTDTNPFSIIFKIISNEDVILLFSKFENYDMVLLVHPDYGKDNISTKFYEIIYSRTPVFLISEAGIASDFLISNKLGYHARKGEIHSVLNQLISFKNNIPYNKSYDVSGFSLPAITSQIIKLLTH